MTRRSHRGLFAWLGWTCLCCTARPSATPQGIELPDPNEDAKQSGALIASGAQEPVTSPEPDDAESFVYSRLPPAEADPTAPQLPIHINEKWWPFRAAHLGISVAEARQRDAEFSDVRIPSQFWDAQIAVETVSVWTVLCNECHGGRRSLEDARETPAPAANWGQGEGLFFGNRRTYSHMYNVVKNGGPRRENRREEMPAWGNILSTEMIWALLYFLEYQSGGIESRFPPSLYPRRPKMLDKR